MIHSTSTLVGSAQAQFLVGDALARLRDIPSGFARTCVTSPPYYNLRDYGMAEQAGQEDSLVAYLSGIVEVFREVRRVLTRDGTLWLNLGDSFAANRAYQVPSTKGGAKHSQAQGSSGAMRVPDGCKPKDLIGVPWRVAFALQDDGWYLRSDIVWHKPNAMPESVRDRPTRAHEYVFLLSRSPRYFYDQAALMEPSIMRPQRRLTPRGSARDMERGTHRRPAGGTGGGMRNGRDVWDINTKPYKGAHCAVMPTVLARRCVAAGSAVGDIVLDPYAGAGTTALAALELGRRSIGIELNPDYARQAAERVGAIVVP